jgi:hypothetical protein
MCRRVLPPLGLLLLLLAGCGFAAMPTQRPSDFAVRYTWQEGSLPPPYHYEYAINIGADGQGDVVMIPDYPADDVPRWRESFVVADADLDRLYRQFVDQGVFTRSWQAETALHVGGSSESMQVLANGSQVEIPASLIDRQAAAVAELYAALRALVPPEQWTKLETQRQQYQESYKP